jgi:DNA-binding IclR family transcriptional regulator
VDTIPSGRRAVDTRAVDPGAAAVTSGVGVLDKAVEILAAVHAHGPLSLAGLVQATGLSRPTAHRLACALEDHRILGRDDAGRFKLGLRLFELGSAALGDVGLVDAARPVLADLRDATGESAQLYVRDGDHRVCLLSAEPRSGLRDTVPVGTPLPLDAGSGGRVLLAHSDDARRFPGVDAELLADVRRRGWAESAGEREPGVGSVSAPVRGPGGRVVAAVSVSGPLERLGASPGRRHATAVVAAAHDVERRLAGG